MKYQIIVETTTHHVYEVEASSEKEAKEKLNETTYCITSYDPNWPNRQEPNIVSIEEI